MVLLVFAKPTCINNNHILVISFYGSKGTYINSIYSKYLFPFIYI